MISTRLIAMTAALSFMISAAGCATHKACSDRTCAADADTTATVSAAIAAHPDLGPPGLLQVWTVNHVVYLSGVVNSGYQRSVAESLASQTDGVTKVVNSISVSR